MNCANRSFQSYTHFLKHAYDSNCSACQIVPDAKSYAKSLTPKKITVDHTLQ